MFYVAGTMRGVLIKGDVLISGVLIERFHCNWLCVLMYNIEETTCNCMVTFLVNSLVLQITYIVISSSSSISNNDNLSDKMARNREHNNFRETE